DQDLAGLENRLQALEVAGRRDHVAARALDHLDEERRVLRLADLGVPDAVVLAVEQALELLHAVQLAALALLAVGTPEAVRERDELRAVAEVPVAAAVAVARRDRRRAERAAVVAALEREHQAAAAARVAHELQRVLDRLAAAHVEVHAPGGTELL